MLCEFLWKRIQNEESKENADKDETKEEEMDKGDATYDEYRKRYCLDFIRGFFNNHLDDHWFRLRYSPLHKANFAAMQKDRSIAEANAIKEDLKRDQESFLKEVELGTGDRSSQDNHVPLSHLLWGHHTDTIKITDVPPHVSDAQLLHAISHHCSTPPSRISSTSLPPNPNANYCNSLLRSSIAVFPSQQTKQEMIDNLTKANITANRGNVPSHIHRKPDSIPTTKDHDPSLRTSHRLVLELDVDCTDPFGRTDIDADNKGSAPPPSPSGETPKPAPRKATVYIHPLNDFQHISVLSTALSSTSRITRDKNAAIQIAQAKDTAIALPEPLTLASLLENSSIEEESHVLDLAIAYLRRVHLFSFYTGQTAPAEADLLSPHPAGTVYLRLRDADALLATDESPEDDLLVQRLDESIASALRSVSPAETPTLAAEIQSEEELAKKTWFDDHSLLDADGRARCSFHFCRKLFKDKKFLEKHLLKKHPEYLAGEQAKCHDSYMMEAWESQEKRPIPQILVDCGRFGLEPVTVSGVEPTAQDPEPELLKQEESRMEVPKKERFAGNKREYEDSVPPKAEFVDVDDMKDEKVELAFGEDVAVPPPKKKKKKKKIL